MLGRIPLLVNLVERGSGMAALNEFFGSAEQGRGHVALVSGAVAGGKTEFLSHFTERAIESGALLLDATGSRAERDLPFSVVRNIFDNPAFSPDVRSEVMGVLDEWSEEPPAPGRMRAMPRVSSALLRLAEKRTVVIAVDDVHWSDEHSLHFLLYLARRIRQARVLIVLTESTRPHQDNLTFHSELLSQPHCGRIALRMLSERGTTRVIAHHLSPNAAARSAAECHAITGGNPLLLRALLEDWRGGECGEHEGPVPGEMFSQAVLSCLHRGESDALAAARGVAVLGGAESSGLLSRLLGLSLSRVERAVHELRQCALLEGRTFRHGAVRAAVLDATPARELSDLHSRAALLLQGDGAAALEVSRHLVAARREPDSWGVPVLREAAEYALVDDDIEFALRCLELARDACGDAVLRAAIKARLVSLVWRISPAAAEGHIPQLTSELETGQLTPRDFVMSVSYLAWAGRLDTAAVAVEELGRCAELADVAEADEAAIAAAGQWLTMLSPPLRARVKASAGGGTALPSTPRGRASDAYAQAAATVCAALSDRPAVPAVAEAERVLQRYHLSDSTVQPLVFALLALVYSDRLDLALSWCERLLGECSARRAPAWQALLSGVRAEIALRQGDLPVAAHHARSAMAQTSVQSWGVGIALPLATLIQAETGMGAHSEAMALLERPLPDTLFQTLPGLHYLRARGRCHLATGRFHAALRDFLACGELMEGWAIDTPDLVPWRLDAADAWLALGEPERARSLAESQARRGRAAGEKAPRGALLLLLARTSSDSRRRLAMLKEAVEILENGGDRLQLALGLGELARAYRALGESNRARMLVRKAWHVAKSCGAEPLCRQLIPNHTEGASDPAAYVSTGESDAPRDAETLSEAEARVALLAAHGNTNREIATKLFVTVSTVEQHLTRVYRKLNVKRRRDLPTKLSDSALVGIA
ncbi:AAA family ATPase [Streptomyces sp. NPDC088725]|uniref:helix-turn-helix transcriptional regulator n=1 Tax=Streptomyces sp. NPDC088725 TaxID=3365873 RepID=UPI00382B3D9C